MERRRAQGDIGNVAFGVSRGECTLPGWLGKFGTDSASGGGESAAGRDGLRGVIPRSFGDVGQRGTDVVNAARGRAPVRRVCAGIRSTYDSGRVSGELTASQRGDFGNAGGRIDGKSVGSGCSRGSLAVGCS